MDERYGFKTFQIAMSMNAWWAANNYAAKFIANLGFLKTFDAQCAHNM